jgi:hypothetical protein
MTRVRRACVRELPFPTQPPSRAYSKSFPTKPRMVAQPQPSSLSKARSLRFFSNKKVVAVLQAAIDYSINQLLRVHTPLFGRSFSSQLLSACSSILPRDFGTATFKLVQFTGAGFTNCVSPDPPTSYPVLLLILMRTTRVVQNSILVGTPRRK